MKIIQVVPHVYLEAQGPSYSVPRLCEALASRDTLVELHVLSPEPQSQPKGYTRYTHPAWPLMHRLGLSPAMRKALQATVSNADVLHNHSLWMMPNIYAGTIKRPKGCVLVTSPRGTLAPWALQRSRWLKKLTWAAGQRKALHGADCLHATAVSEYREFRDLGLKAPVTIIPNGVDMPPYERPRVKTSPVRRLLFLGRVHPKKRVDVLLRAWARLQDLYPDWELEIAGPDNSGYLAEMKNLAKVLGCNRVTFPGAVYGSEKIRMYQSSDIFVLPTYNENFGMAVAEALACGVPAIVTKGAPWSGLQDHDCGWWIESGEEPLVECLKHALGLNSEKLRDMGLSGRQWMESDFSWTHVAGMMLTTYNWLLGRGEVPPWVELR